jgi:predicted nuclease of predicted toxin-antitoxin system
MNIRFHLDENVNCAISEGLRQRGIDVTTANGASLLGKEDIDHIQFAFHERRVIVTHDVDFLRLNNLGIPHAGIVYSPLHKRKIREMILSLDKIYRIYSSEELIGKIIFI